MPLVLASRLLLAVLVALGAGGCGALPTLKLLDGDVEGGVYTAEEGRFSLVVPQAADAYEYRYLNIKEAHAPQEEYVSFGPAAGDRRIFRANVTWWPVGVDRPRSFDDLATLAIAAYASQLERGYGVAPIVLRTGPESIGAHRAVAWEAEQHVPAGAIMSNAPTHVRHAVWVIDMPDAIASMCVEWYPDLPAASATGLDAGRAFAESLVVH
jgi:hypothetical protein